MDFEEMEKFNSGAKFMTLIKGDVDNLGLIMSSGLVGNRDNGKINQKDNDLTGVSRTTTLSNHLKYFFSFSLNGFLANWEKGEIEKSVDDNYTDDQKVYTVFAGGDDLMLVCPQSSALKLLEAFNRTFNDFVCNNPEVHISYSLTNFKHNTPIRLVADMAEDNQDEVKSSLKSENILNLIEKNNEIFSAKHNKASFRLFETNLKNEEINKLIKDKQTLIQNVNDNNLTIGIIRDLLYFANMMKNFREQGDTQNLLWLPLFTYKINNKIKHKGLYKNKQLEDFFEAILKVNKNEKEIRDEVSLYSLANELIYSLRK
jgi:CRISPR-associated protein Csm1